MAAISIQIYRENKPRPLAAIFFNELSWLEQSWLRVSKGTFLPSYTEISPVVSDKKIFKIFCIEIRGSCKKFCHRVWITSVLRFIKHSFITNLQSITPLLKHIFVTFLPSREKQINSLLLVSVGDTDK